MHIHRSFGGFMIHDCIVEQTKCHFKEGNTGEKKYFQHC
jgi:hypothetical protein